MKKMIILLPCLLIGLLAGCEGKNKLSGENAGTSTDVKRIAPEYTVVTNKTVDLSSFLIDAEGYTILFDGKSMHGWRGYGQDHIPGKWTIENNAIKFSAKDDESQKADGGDLLFAYPLKNFRLELEWKISKGGNSGIFYLAQEVQTKDMETNRMVMQPIFISAPEYQVLDNLNHPDAGLGENGNRKSASLYDMIPADPQNAKPFGEWNQCAIMVLDGIVTHTQNGVVVTSYRLWTPLWTAMLQSSKFSGETWPLAFELLNNCGGPDHKGYIGFQDHGDDVWFRHIRIKQF